MTELEHVDRFRVLLACATTPTSPASISSKIELGQKAYHFRRLGDQGYLRTTRTRQRRGATETFWTATAKGRKLLAQLGVDGSEDAGA